MKLLFLHENLVGWVAMHLNPAWVQHPALREIVVRRLAALAGETWTSLGAFLDGCETAEMQNLITEAVAEGRPIPNPEQQLADVVLRLRNQFYERQLRAGPQLCADGGQRIPSGLSCCASSSGCELGSRSPWRRLSERAHFESGTLVKFLFSSGAGVPSLRYSPTRGADAGAA